MMCDLNKTVRLLLEKGCTVSTAESCTGGMVSAAFTDFPGISSVFLEGVVTYANEAKIRLGVKAETLKAHGAVSREVAGEMAAAVRERAQSTIGVSTTGIAGPDGGTAKKPVGLVYVGISTEQGTKTYALRLFGDRKAVRCKTVQAVFRFIYRELEELYYGEN